MYKLIVVDDEAVIRKGLVNGNPWNAWGFEIVGQAADGIEAIEEIQNKKPEVVLTDIRMPKYDGVQLMEYLNTNYPEIKIIILSGYSDFEYLNKSIKNNVFDYLLKPTLEEDFIDLFSRLKTKLDEEKSEKEYIKELEWAQQLMKLNSYLMGISTFTHEEMTWIPKEGIVTLWTMEKENREEAFDQLKANNLKSQTVFYQILPETVIGISAEKPRQLFRHMQKKYPSLSVGASTKFGDKNYYSAYQEAKEALEQTRYTGSGKWIDAESLSNRNISPLVQEILHILSEEYKSNVVSLDYIGERVGKSPSYISKLFKKEMGYNFTAYITKKRMEKAKEMLQDISYKVYEVGEELGYADPSTFIKVFRKTYGMSPNEYREG
jgi:two-component system response regulator YesN